jgi:hypothetical protein
MDWSSPDEIKETRRALAFSVLTYRKASHTSRWAACARQFLNFKNIFLTVKINGEVILSLHRLYNK